ncbi:MAG: general secretion pathway protein GspB [Gammaproteobacteria bacterium]|jgi:general secretion pathway protein B
MSYILDALNKSEQERGRGNAPSVQTLHTTGQNYPATKTHYWPYILLVAVFVNIAALLYFITADTRVEQPAPTQQSLARIEPRHAEIPEAPAKTQDTASIVQEPANEIIYKPVSMPAVTQAAVRPTYEITDTAPTAYTPAQSAMLQRDELPTSVQQHIPIMEFSAHVYSSNPLHRSIVINGRFMEEGDQLASDLTLSEITPKGAIFNFQGQLFHQNVVSAWN